MEEERKRQPKWQRACVHPLKDDGFQPHEIWVRYGPPYLPNVAGVSPIDGRAVAVEPSYETNLFGPGGRVNVNASAVELLARSPNDFADEVEIEPFEEWKARAAKGDHNAP